MEQYYTIKFICIKEFTEEDLTEIKSSKYQFSYPNRYNMIILEINEIYDIVYDWYTLNDEGECQIEIKKGEKSLGVTYSPIIRTHFEPIDSPLGKAIIRNKNIDSILN